MTGEATVPEMGEGEDQRAGDGERAVRRQAVTAVRHGAAGDQQGKSERTEGRDDEAAMAPEADRKGDGADGHRDQEHLRVKLIFGQNVEKRQKGEHQRQRQAMNEAKAGKGDRGLVENSGLCAAVIRHRLPLCSLMNGQRPLMGPLAGIGMV
ncbi:MAG TPA: hypothetical protein VE175_11235 [Woeseiaceae bacterium]|nr:hypothetical protein [Woeseiaceae bacterium]